MPRNITAIDSLVGPVRLRTARKVAALVSATRPRRLSGWLRQALKDLRAISLDGRYHLDMRRGYDPIGARVHVGLGGALYAQTFEGLRRRATYADIDLPYSMLCLMHALDECAHGRVLKALARVAACDLLPEDARRRANIVVHHQCIPDLAYPNYSDAAPEAAVRMAASAVAAATAVLRAYKL